MNGVARQWFSAETAPIAWYETTDYKLNNTQPYIARYSPNLVIDNPTYASIPIATVPVMHSYYNVAGCNGKIFAYFWDTSVRKYLVKDIDGNTGTFINSWEFEAGVASYSSTAVFSGTGPSIVVMTSTDPTNGKREVNPATGAIISSGLVGTSGNQIQGGGINRRFWTCYEDADTSYYNRNLEFEAGSWVTVREVAHNGIKDKRDTDGTYWFSVSIRKDYGSYRIYDYNSLANVKNYNASSGIQHIHTPLISKAG